ncbi:hypothetical protein TrLO_g12402 [Triparma laevis f. longispina]|uniref:DUF547 domain-containing protein n=1 Tax=Triparma laevis f. longispina TaxID=1714387 RepID=A0A9W7KZ70_9STRA|nr:hypothetical protein TrLO_g12402 [Triparma laevis f. longispina]
MIVEPSKSTYKQLTKQLPPPTQTSTLTSTSITPPSSPPPKSPPRPSHVSSKLSKTLPPSLQPLLILDASTTPPTRIPPNSPTPYSFENQYFKGDISLMFKTPDSPLPHIFTNKARMFEFQFQGEFLQKPSHPIYLSVSFKDPPKIGIMMRTIVGAGLNWVKKVNKGFYYTLGKEGERPRVAFPLIYAVDRLVVSDVGEKGLPKVGQVIEGESEEEVKKRKKGLGDPIVFETDKVYSIALWSAFVDWVKWRVCNIPGVRPFGMESVTSGQPLTFCIYELEGSHGVEEGEKKNVFAEFEISLIGKTNPPAHLPEEDTDSEEENEEDTSLWMSYDTPLKVKSSDSEVTDGGGFACLQSQGGVGYCVLKKPSPNTQTSSNPTSNRVRFGDCVLIRSEGVSQRIKWLSTHRGWWLKWISTMPKHNGHFIVEGGVEGDFVTVGGSWTLRHKRWKGYIVGASQSTNAKYGGRMMGLLKSTTTSTSTTEDDLELEREMAEDDGSGSKKKKPWMEQVKFKAFHAMEEEEEEEEGGEGAEKGEDAKAVSEYSNSKLDVPAWVEAMHRTKRKRTLCYVVRARGEKNCISLRTGADFTKVFQIREGPRESDSDSDSSTEYHGSSSDDEPSLRTPDKIPVPLEFATSPEVALSLPPPTPPPSPGDGSSSSSSGRGNFSKVAGMTKKAGGKGFALAKGTLKLSAKVGLGTMSIVSNGGMAVAKGGMAVARKVTPKGPAPKANKLPKKIVGGKSSFSRDDLFGTPAEKDRRKSTKKKKSINSGLSLTISNPAHTARKPAAAMSAPDHSARILSNFVTDVSELSLQVLSAQISRPSDLDAWFLQGGSAELGVVPQGSKPQHECVVGRALWETHWREEWCGVYASHVAFYAPLSKKPAFVLPHRDVLTVRSINNDDSPLPTLSIVALDTPGRVHYLAFRSADERSDFEEKVKAAVFSASESDSFEEISYVSSDPRENFVLKSGQWAGVAGSNKSNRRVVLNARRMRFDGAGHEDMRKKLATFEQAGYLGRSPGDIEVTESGVEQTGASFSSPPATSGSSDSPEINKDVLDFANFVEVLLKNALSLSPESSLEDLVGFLNMTSCLRSLDLNAIDYNSDCAVMLFVNIYHCLLQHALLLLGPPSKTSVSHFFRCVCYEIGGDVFSLSELEHLVIRGKLCAPSAGRIEPTKSSEGFKKYSLGNVDARINFVLHNGLSSSDPVVPVLSMSAGLSRQMNDISTASIQRALQVDGKKRLVVLPEVCRVFRDDFGDDNVSVLRFLLRFLEKQSWEAVSWLLAEQGGGGIKFRFRNSGDFLTTLGAAGGGEVSGGG